MKNRARLSADLRPSKADPADTKTKILDAAFRRLVDEGYAALSVREIAKDAGVNHALINYHFRTKDQLVIAVLEAANQRLLERQERMYQADSSFAQKWAQARCFYADDLASGFVRLQAELIAASLSNPSLREKFVPQIAAWKGLVTEGARDALRALTESDSGLPSALSAEAIGCWVSYFWLGMEFADLLGHPFLASDHASALDAMRTLLEQLDTRVADSKRRAHKPKPYPKASKRKRG